MLNEDAPVTVANFLGYVNRGDYTGTFIHRSLPGFVIQGGGYIYNPELNAAPHITTQPAIVNEFKISNTRGTVAMAKSANDPNSATSEWFVNLDDNSGNLDNQNGGFTVFGVVINDGMTVVDQIAALPIENFNGTFTDTPTIDFTGTINADIFVELTSLEVGTINDFDEDGINDSSDTDDDNDGTPDETDAFPFDATENVDLDSDGTGDVADTDDDGDGVIDDEDEFPIDGEEWVDSDGDGIGDNADADNDTAATVYLLTTSTSTNFTVLHIINSSTVAQRFTGTLYNRDGIMLGSSNTPLDSSAIASQGRQLLTPSELEILFGVEPWTGPAMLEVSGTAQFDLMTKLTSPSGLVSNTNCVRENSVHNIEGIDSANMTFIRFINTGSETISSITASLIDGSGMPIGDPGITLFTVLAAKQAMWFKRTDLEELFGTTWSGMTSLNIEDSAVALKLLNLNFVNGETFFNFSCFENSESGFVYLMTNSASENISETHIINTALSSVEFTTNLYNADGDLLGAMNSSIGQIEPGARTILTAIDIELLTGADVWSGPALIEISSDDCLKQ